MGELSADMPGALPNPEAEWRESITHPSDPTAEANARVGGSFTSVTMLAGGHANLNLRLNADRVLRIYKRDARSLAKEKRLLNKDWQSFRVPKILGEGRDFLVLEWIEMEPVLDDRHHGRALGIAAAEIHSTHFENSGILDRNLQVVEPLPETIAYVSSILHHLGSSWKRLESEVTALLQSEIKHEAPSRHVLNHGDFKASNLFVDPVGRVVILDWEFAFSGPRFFDQGQLFRWGSSKEFEEGFEEGYQERDSAILPANWKWRSEVLDLLNLLDLAKGATSDPTRMADLHWRIEQTLEQVDLRPR